MDPEHRPSKITSAPLVALIKREIDARSDEDQGEVLADLFWAVWPTVRAQDH